MNFKIHQYHPTYVKYDAVSNHMLFVQTALAKVGVGGTLFAHSIGKGVGGDHQRFSKKSLPKGDLLLIHHSMGFKKLGEVLQWDIPKAIVYENITPAEFLSHDPHLKQLSLLGRKQLKLLSSHVKYAFTTSHYNGAELKANGFPPYSLFPLVDVSTIPNHPPSKFRGKFSKQIIFVGRICPHKNQTLLVECMHFLKELGRYELILVGKEDPLYGQYLRHLVRALDLEDRVRITGTVSDQELDHLYEMSDIFVCPSLHEGFCIPLVEAIRHQLPIVALDTPGVKETLGGCAVLAKSPSPINLAVLIDSVLSKSAFQQKLLNLQEQRYGELLALQSEKRLQNLCLDLLHAPKRTVPPTDALIRHNEKYGEPEIVP